MSESFSQRFGFAPSPDVVQLHDLPAASRREVYDLIYLGLFRPAQKQSERGGSRRIGDLRGPLLGPFIRIGVNILELTLDDVIDQALHRFVERCKQLIINGPFNNVCDLIEVVLAADQEELADLPDLDHLPGLLNDSFRRTNFGYRLIERRFVRVSDDNEAEELSNALQSLDPYEPARQHLLKALAFLSPTDGSNPDAANCAKEGISAFESLTSILLEGEADFSKRINKIGDRLGIHRALVQSWIKLYAYASDEPGVRHGTGAATEITSDEARYVVVAVSAAINFLVAKQA